MKKRYIATIIIVQVLVLGFITTKIMLARFEENLKQLALLEISDVDLVSAKDGDYTSCYPAFPVSAEVRVNRLFFDFGIY